MHHSRRSITWPALTSLVGAYILIAALPPSWTPWAPAFMNPPLHLGLDLQGGTQLDFRISETEMEQQVATLRQEIAALKDSNAPSDDIREKEAQMSNIQFLSENIIESIRSVLERRINSLGVSEAVITPSYYGDEKHLLVECPGVVDVQECIRTVGKTILLEFKEQSQGEDEEHIATMRALAEQSFARVTGSGIALETVGQDIGARLGVAFGNGKTFFEDELPQGIEDIWSRHVGDAPILREVLIGFEMQDNKPVIHKGMMLAELVREKETVDRTLEDPQAAMEQLVKDDTNLSLQSHPDVPLTDLDAGFVPDLEKLQKDAIVAATDAAGKKAILFVTKRTEDTEEISASHLLVSYTGAARADASVTRTKEEARTRAEQLREQLVAGEDFASLTRKESDGPSAATDGSLGTFRKGEMTPAFEQAAFALQEVGAYSPLIETEFGFHIIRLDKPAASIPGNLSYEELLIADDPDGAIQTRLTTALNDKTVTEKGEQISMRYLFFSFLPTGWKDTQLDGKHFRRASVTTDPVSGVPVVQIVFDDEGGRLFQELTGRNVGKPIAIFVGGDLVSAPTVQTEISGGVAVITGSKNYEEANTLAQDLNTGAIPAPIHLVGQSTIEATLGVSALQQSIYAALLGYILIAILMIFYYRILGVIAALALLCYIIIFVALLKLPVGLISNSYIVLSLAGIAGIILSIGMAVDANVLIFERMKEELAKGKLLSTAADTGFKRAWPSIRDSNLSTLLTAFILFIIGTSIVRGFAVTLSIGILLSMFTSIVISRFLIRQLYKLPVAENLAAFGVRLSEPKKKASGK